MQPCSKEMQGMASMIALQELQNSQNNQIQNPQISIHPSPHFDHSASSHDDFLDQMLSSYPSWSENQKQLFSLLSQTHPDDSSPGPESLRHNPFDESILLASRLRQHQISGNSGDEKPMVLPQQLLGRSAAERAAAAGCIGGGDSGLIPLPLTLGSADSSHSGLDINASFRSHNAGGEVTLQGLYNGFTGSLARTAQANNQQQHFQHPQSGSLGSQNFGAPTGAGSSQAPAVSGAIGGGTAPRQRVRARRGQATDPHSIAERLRRERIAERMKALQELVPNANKTDKASMLDEIIDYVKFLQLQVKVLSMSRLGGAAAVAPLVAEFSSEGGLGRSSSGAQSGSTNDSLTVTEHQVAKLMEEDMGSAMQYLQGKGLCLMPISLASAISSATRNANPLLVHAGDAPSSPSMSVLTVQSAIANGGGGGGGGGEASVKDATSVSKP